jgi:protein arginine kinase activator
MICEACHEKEATVHLTQVADGAVKKVHLCEECAAKSGFDIHGPLSIQDILLGIGQVPGETSVGPERSCPTCHFRRADFKKTGRLGCPDCYETFSAELLPLIKAMHRSDQHMGKVPSCEGTAVRMSSEIAAIQKALDQAISNENYEEAARLRDQIQIARNRATGSETKESP